MRCTQPAALHAEYRREHNTKKELRRCGPTDYKHTATAAGAKRQAHCSLRHRSAIPSERVDSPVGVEGDRVVAAAGHLDDDLPGKIRNRAGLPVSRDKRQAQSPESTERLPSQRVKGVFQAENESQALTNLNYPAVRAAADCDHPQALAEESTHG